MKNTFSRTLVAVLVLLTSLRAAAGSPKPAAGESPSVPPLVRHALYLEFLGKGGLWGAGYDYQFASHFAAGATLSYSMLDGQYIFSASPYLTAYPLKESHHRWFVQLGPQLVSLATKSPVPEWSDRHSTGLAAQFSTGYEYRSRFLLRVYPMVVLGKRGFAPWFGLSVGWTF